MWQNKGQESTKYETLVAMFGELFLYFVVVYMHYCGCSQESDFSK